MTMPIQNRTVIFLHIPKTAGTTLETVLARQYRSRETFYVNGAQDVREERYRQLHESERARIRLIKGHMFFGIHAHVPNAYTYITVLRNPIDRVISHYYYVRSKPSHPFYQIVHERNMSLHDYVTSGMSPELENNQVRTLFGPDHRSVPHGECSRAMLDTAQQHLKEHFSVVGLADRFDETLLLMKVELGWRGYPVYESRNVTRSRPVRTAVSSETMKQIEMLNLLDIELYENAHKAFEEHLERRKQELSGALQRLQTLNGVYHSWNFPVRMLRSTVGKAVAISRSQF